MRSGFISRISCSAAIGAAMMRDKKTEAQSFAEEHMLDFRKVDRIIHRL